MAFQFENTAVLIIDDMTPMLATTASMLKVFGFKHIYTAADPVEGFEKFCAHNPDLVITDWLMEPYDGIALTEKIRTDPRSPNQFVPIILMTGYSAKVRVMEARDKGVTEFMVKPFSAKDLAARIEQLIEKPRKFVHSKEFFGPDRRRRKDDSYNGPRRRGAEKATDSPPKRLDDVLKDLKDNADKP